MRRLHIFLFVLTITLTVLLTLALVSWYFAATSPSFYGSSWMGQMWGPHLGTDGNYGGMGGMMGGDSYETYSYLWIIPTALIGVVVVAIIGVGFYLYLPELRYIRPKGACSPNNLQTAAGSTQESSKPLSDSGSFTNNVSSAPNSASAFSSNTSNVPNSCEVLLKTMTPEEQKVLGVLISHKGKYLQKYVVKETGLSRLKTHRIVARFAQRGIVTIKEFGNTNEIAISDWVQTKNP
jgi:uncharacterized membrane protein